MQVELAKSAGFCFGVQRAVDTYISKLKKIRQRRSTLMVRSFTNEEVIKDDGEKGS